MRLRHLLLTIALLPLAMACKKQTTAFVLNGTLDAADSIPILVTGIDSRYDQIDTIIPADGRFSYSCSLDTVTPLLMLFSDGRKDVVFADKSLEATYERHIGDSMATVSGGLYNEEYRQFNEGLAESNYIDQIDSLIKRNPTSEVVPYLLYSYSMMPDADNKRILDAIKNMGGQMLDNVLVTDIKRDATENSRFNGSLTAMNVRDTLMQKVRITDICKSGHMLICVWASWSDASRQAHKDLSPLIEEFKKKDFQIAGLSIDTNPDRWLEAISQDSIEWAQYCDQGGWSGRLVQQTDIDVLPYYLIMAQNGRIISRSADLDVVKKRLQEVVKDLKKTKK